MKADPMDDTNISTWTPIGDAPPLAANGTVVSAQTNATANEPSTASEPSTANEPSHAMPQWLPVGTGPQGIADPNTSSSWSSALRSNPSATQSAESDRTQNPGFPGASGIATLNSADEVRHGGPFSRNAWLWSLAAVAGIIGSIVAVELILSRLIDRFESGTPQRLAIICASLFSNDVIMLGVLIIVVKALGMSFRSFGIRRPADMKESIVLAFAAWLIFLLLAGVWAMVSQSEAEREANNPFLRDKTVNTRDTSASAFGDGSELESTVDSSAKEASTQKRSANNGTTESKDDITAKDSTANTELEQVSGFSDEAATGGPGVKSGDVADNRHALIKVLNDNPPKALLISILITGCIGAPLLEELLVRGFLFGAFSQRFGKLAGGAISSLLFGFAHIMAYPLKMIPPLVIMGAALAWLAWQTGSIVPGMFIHAFVNSLGLGIAASLGGHILTLMVGSWLVLGIILLPWIRQKKSPAAQAGR
jgi:hypothetical protein